MLLETIDAKILEAARIAQADMEAKFKVGKDNQIYRKEMLAEGRIECDPVEASEAAHRQILEELHELI